MSGHSNSRRHATTSSVEYVLNLGSVSIYVISTGGDCHLRVDDPATCDDPNACPQSCAPNIRSRQMATGWALLPTGLMVPKLFLSLMLAWHQANVHVSDGDWRRRARSTSPSRSFVRPDGPPQRMAQVRCGEAAMGRSGAPDVLVVTVRAGDGDRNVALERVY
jgi:hypothetical protein